MRAVGIRELKNRLSEYLRRVRAGETILVTDRGEVVAEIRSPGAGARADELPPGLADLVRRGVALPGADNDPSLYRRFPRLVPGGAACELLDDERGER